MQRFEHQTVIITGAGSGIGWATAQRFLAEGAHVVAVDKRAERLAALRDEMASERLEVATADVSVPSQVAEAVHYAVAQKGVVHHVVNSAGEFCAGDFVDSDLSQYRHVMSTNVDGLVYVCRATLPWLLQSGGSITNVSSVSGLAADWGLAFYNASKAAISNLTRSLALEYGGRGVRVNAVTPCVTRTPMTHHSLSVPAVREAFASRIPLGRAAEPHEVAAAIAFLASNDASFITGVNLPVDGGLTASNGQPNVGALL